jgi:hypothetical protein
MKSKIQLLVVAILTSSEGASRDDKRVPGVYSLMVDADLTPAAQASAVLDCFHANESVDVLDAFDFYVVDPKNKQRVSEDPSHEDYSLSDHAEYDQQIRWPLDKQDWERLFPGIAFLKYGLSDMNISEILKEYREGRIVATELMEWLNTFTVAELADFLGLLVQQGIIPPSYYGAD